MAETLADLYREVGLNFRSAAVGLAEQTPYTPSTPLRRPARPQPRQGDYARERQYRIEGARDQFLHGRTLGDRVGAAGEIAWNTFPGLAAFPAARNAVRAGQAGDAVSAGFEGGTAALSLLEPLGVPGRSMRPLLGAARAPAEAAVSTEATRVPFPRIRDGTTWVRPEADYAAAHEGLRPQFGSERLYHGTSADVQGPLRPSKRSGFPEPTGVSLAHSPETAGQFGNAIYPVNTRGSIGDAEAFMRRARALMSEGMPETQASAQAQREFQNAGYTGVRWGNRETTMFNSEDMRPAIGTPAESPQRIPRAIQPQTRASDGTILPAQPRETFGRPFRRTEANSDDLRDAAAFDPARSGESDLLASVGAPVAAAALFGGRKRRK